MPLPYNRDLIPRAKELRKNMTPQERKLWYLFLQHYPVRFQRQKTIGGFIVDFFSEKALLAVELDGSPHFTEHGIAYDAERTILLRQVYIDVIRFTNNDVDFHFEEVCRVIDEKVKAKYTPPVAPCPSQREGYEQHFQNTTCPPLEGDVTK